MNHVHHHYFCGHESVHYCGYCNLVYCSNCTTRWSTCINTYTTNYTYTTGELINQGTSSGTVLYGETPKEKQLSFDFKGCSHGS